MINPTLIFNDHDFSREIPGFCLLDIQGRESQKRNITDLDIPGRRGSQYRSARYEPKTLKAKYCIHEAVNRKKGARYNALQGLLSGEQKRLIFTDEPDKYWIATVSAVTKDTITFYCADPCKYALLEKVEDFSPTSLACQKQLRITNEGTEEVPVRYEVDLYGESGYVGLASAQGAMEFGSRSETDRVYGERDEQVMGWGDFPAGNDAQSHHTLQRIRVPQDGGDRKNMDWIALGYSAGVGDHPRSGWCHSWNTYTVPKTSQNGDVMDFEFRGLAWFECGGPAQIGEMIIECLGERDGSECQIARLTLSKGSADFAADCLIHVNGQTRKTFRFTPNGQNPFAGGTGSVLISTEGHTVIVRPGSDGNTIRCDVSGFESVPLKKIRIYIGHMPYVNPDRVTRLYFGNLMLIAKHVKGEFDTRNTFFPGPNGLRLTIDGITSKFYVDGTYRPDLEVIGPKWFLIPPGTHTVSLILSDWYSAKVSAKAFIREAWL